MTWLTALGRELAAHLGHVTVALAGLGILATLTLRRAPARFVHRVELLALGLVLVPAAVAAPLLAPVLQLAAAAGVSASAGATWIEVVRAAVEPPAPVPGSPATWPWAVLAVVHLAGVALVAATRIVRRRGTAAARPGRLSDLDRASRDKLRAALAASGVPERALRFGTGAGGPATVGFVRPRILVPLRVVDALEPLELRAVVLHEDEHRRRRDPLRLAIAGVATALFWSYPPVWWLSKRLRASAESACDEGVLARGVPGSTYARALCRAVLLDLGPPAAHAAGLGRRRGLSDRLERIDRARRYPPMLRHRLSSIAAAAAVALWILPPLPAGAVPAPAAADKESAPAPTWERLGDLAAAGRTVTVVGNDVALGDELRRLGFEAGFDVRIETPLPTADSLSFIAVPLAEVLSRLAASYGLDYEVPDAHTLVVRALPLAGVGDVSSPRVIPESQKRPVYPEDAREAKVEGQVILQALIRADGSVDRIEVLRAKPAEFAASFERSARDAIRQWRYEPALRNGKPVDVWFTVFVQFSLQ